MEKSAFLLRFRAFSDFYQKLAEVGTNPTRAKGVDLNENQFVFCNQLLSVQKDFFLLQSVAVQKNLGLFDGRRQGTDNNLVSEINCVIKKIYLN